MRTGITETAITVIFTVSSVKRDAAPILDISLIVPLFAPAAAIS